MDKLNTYLQLLINRLTIRDERLSPQVQYQANLLRIVIYGNLISITLLMLYAIFGNISDKIIGLLVMTTIIVLNIWGLQGVKARKIKTVGRIIIGAGCISFVMGAFYTGGVYSSAMLGLLSLLVSACFLLDVKDRMILFVAIILSFFGLLFIELSGNLPYAPFKDLPFRIILLCTTASILFLIVNYHLYANRQSEIQIRQLQVNAERFRVQQELTQDLAHDLRTPLSTLQATSYLIRQRYERDMPIEGTIQKLEEQVKRVNSMIEDLFQMTLLDVDDKKRTLVIVELRELLELCIGNATPFANSRKIAITLHVSTSAPSRVIGDKKQLMRVFENLIQNSIHYGNEGGYIKISLSFDNPYHIVKVEDNGIGIALEHQSKIFERFFRVDSARTHRENQGAGVGLNAAQRIVQFHGGNIHLLSEAGQGSTFTVILPSIDHVEPIQPFNRVTMEYKTKSE